MPKRKPLSPKAQAYFQAFRKMMESKERIKDSIEDRILSLLYTVVDPTCPLYKPYIEKDSPPSVDDIVELIGMSGNGGASTVRDVLNRLGGQLGQLSFRSQAKLRPAIPRIEEYAEINEMRTYLELKALLRLHQLEDKRKKRDIIEGLAMANAQMGAIALVTSSYSDDELRERVSSDPKICGTADEFWRLDRRFHYSPSLCLGMKLNADVLQILLDRTRLSASNRLVMLKRFPKSHSEHDAIIKAVQAEPGTCTKVQVVQAVEDHLASTIEDYGVSGG